MNMLYSNHYSIFLFDSKLYRKKNLNILIDELTNHCPYAFDINNVTTIKNGAGTLVIVYKEKKLQYSKENVLSVLLARELCKKGQICFYIDEICEKFTFENRILVDFEIVKNNEKVQSPYFKMNTHRILLSEIKKKQLLKSCDISNKSNIHSIISYTSIFLFILLSLLIFNKEKIKKQNLENIKNKEELIRKKELAQKELELQNQYSSIKEKYKLALNSYNPSPYVIICELYKVISGKGQIENLVIEKKLISIEGTTNKALELLKNFELNTMFKNAVLNNVSTNGNNEKFKLVCEYNEIHPSMNENILIEDKIKFYNDQVDKLETSYVKFNSFSQAIELNNKLMKIAGCELRNMAYSADYNFIYMDCTIYGQNTNLMKYLQLAYQNKLRIDKLNYTNSTLMIRINTGLILSNFTTYQNIENIENFSEVDPYSLSQIMIKKQAHLQNKYMQLPEPDINKKENTENIHDIKVNDTKRFEYLGIINTDDFSYLLVREVTSSQIIKLPESNILQNKSNCIIFVYENCTYEVIK